MDIVCLLLEARVRDWNCEQSNLKSCSWLIGNLRLQSDFREWFLYEIWIKNYEWWTSMIGGYNWNSSCNRKVAYLLGSGLKSLCPHCLPVLSWPWALPPVGCWPAGAKKWIDSCSSWTADALTIIVYSSPIVPARSPLALLPTPLLSEHFCPTGTHVPSIERTNSREL